MQVNAPKSFNPKNHAIVVYNINLDDKAFFKKVRTIEAKSHVDFLITLDGKKHEVSAEQLASVLRYHFDD